MGTLETVGVNTPTKDQSLALLDAQVDVPDWFLLYFKASLADPLMNFPDPTMTWIADQVALRGLGVPIGQVIGAQNFNAVAAPFILTDESTTSATYDDLTTVGPSLSGLADGKYVIQFGCAAYADVDAEAGMSIETNSDAAVDDDACVSQTVDFVSIGMTVAKTLNGGNNSVTAKYRVGVGAGTAHFARRWLIAQRYANL